MDGDGVSLAFILPMATAAPEETVDFFERMVSDTAVISQFGVPCRVYGKESSRTAINKIRCILPLPVLLMVCDVLVSRQLQSIIDKHFKTPAYAFHGGVKFTQPLQ